MTQEQFVAFLDRIGARRFTEASTSTSESTEARLPGQCFCHRPGNDRCDCSDARVEAAELSATFRLRYDADMRAIKRWQGAHPGNDLTWPDHADLVVWLMEQLTESRKA